jgi:hypothetical protein
MGKCLALEFIETLVNDERKKSFYNANSIAPVLITSATPHGFDSTENKSEFVAVMRFHEAKFVTSEARAQNN